MRLVEYASEIHDVVGLNPILIVAHFCRMHMYTCTCMSLLHVSYIQCIWYVHVHVHAYMWIMYVHLQKFGKAGRCIVVCVPVECEESTSSPVIIVVYMYIHDMYMYITRLQKNSRV